MSCRLVSNAVASVPWGILLAGALAVAAPLHASDDYTLGPDSQPQPGVPKGQVIGPTLFKSTIFGNTVRQYWVYVPAQYDGNKPAAVAQPVRRSPSRLTSQAAMRFQLANVRLTTHQ